jgi:NADP-dependent 3-hydroxy acid dehydrogenase YdfG
MSKSSESKGLVVITGASSGIGAATAQEFSRLGHPLLLLARRLDRLESLKLPNTICAKVDVMELEAFKQALAKAEAAHGPTDCLVNNAGVMLLGQIATQDPAEWKKMLDINIMGLLNGIHLVLNGMIRRKGGTIINVSSVAGRKTFPNHVAYCGTKFAVHALSENLRQEVAPHGVRVVTIAPGAVETELLGHTTDASVKDGYEQWKEAIGGAIAAEDVARAIAFAQSQPPNVCIREIVLAATRQEP